MVIRIGILSVGLLNGMGCVHTSGVKKLWTMPTRRGWEGYIYNSLVRYTVVVDPSLENVINYKSTSPQSHF